MSAMVRVCMSLRVLLLWSDRNVHSWSLVLTTHFTPTNTYQQNVTPTFCSTLRACWSKNKLGHQEEGKLRKQTQDCSLHDVHLQTTVKPQTIIESKKRRSKPATNTNGVQLANNYHTNRNLTFQKQGAGPNRSKADPQDADS
jgi:hypothetical protein